MNKGGEMNIVMGIVTSDSRLDGMFRVTLTQEELESIEPIMTSPYTELCNDEIIIKSEMLASKSRDGVLHLAYDQVLFLFNYLNERAWVFPS